MLNKNLFIILAIFLVLSDMAIGQNVTPSLINRNIEGSSAALVSRSRHPLVLSNVNFRALFNDLINVSRSQSDNLLPGAYDPRSVNAFFFGIASSIPYLNLGRRVGISAGDSKDISHYSTLALLKFNTGGFYYSAYLNLKNLSVGNKIGSSKIENPSTIFGLSTAYLVIPSLSIGLSANSNSVKENSLKTQRFGVEGSVSANIYKDIYLALRTKFVFVIGKAFGLYISPDFGGGFSVDTNISLFSNIRYEIFVNYRPTSFSPASLSAGAMDENQITLTNILEGQVGNFVVSYQKDIVWTLPTTIQRTKRQGSSTWKDRISFTLSAVGNFSRTGIDIIHTTGGPESGPGISLQEFIISQGFVF